MKTAKLFLSNKFFALLCGVVMALILARCGPGLYPQLSYQGRLTDQDGYPLNGNVKIRFSVFNAATGGAALRSETDTVAVTDGLFSTVVGPSTAVSGLTPKDLAQPLWLELQVSNGVYTETLTPRQRLYGSPYAFTLMPGAVISGTMDTQLFGAGGVDAVMTVINFNNGDITNPALPALRVVGETGLEVTSPTNDDGNIYSDLNQSGSDLFLHSNDEIWLYLDDDNNDTSEFRVYSGDGANHCSITEAGNLNCTGTKSAVVDTGQEKRQLYAVESPGVWFEDFGSAALQNGSVFVTIDPLFAKSINLNVEYHLYLTPLGDCNGLYVADKSPTGFEVRELGGGTSNVEFDYRVVAKRVGFENTRLEVVDDSLANEAGSQP